MRKKDINGFLEHLEEDNLKQISPRAFTGKEMVLFGKIRGFSFTVSDLQLKLSEIKETPDEQLGVVAKKWKKEGVIH